MEDVLAVGVRYAVVELNNSVSEILLYNVAANVGKGGAAAGLGPITAAKAKQQQAGASAVGIGNAELCPEIANARIKAGAVEKSDPASAKASLVQQAWAEGVRPRSDNVVDRSYRKAVAKDQQRIA